MAVQGAADFTFEIADGGLKTLFEGGARGWQERRRYIFQ